MNAPQPYSIMAKAGILSASVRGRRHPLRNRLLHPTPLAGCSLVVLASSLLSAGCAKDSTRPSPPEPSQTMFEATLNPGTSTFVLSRVSDMPPGQSSVEIELIGSNLVADATTETISLDVAIRNVSAMDLPAPAHVWLTNFQQAGVEVLNADVLDPPGQNDGTVRFGFDYSSMFGSDNLLSSNETSHVKTWRFRVPGQTSFSFSAVATFAATPGEAVLAGRVFHDLDADGVRDAEEPPYFGSIVLARPDGSTASTDVLRDGRYSIPVRELGLHTLTYQPAEADCVCDIIGTTPNPLQVVILPDENGHPRSYLHADFGVRIDRGGDLSSVVLTDRSPDEIQQDDYRLGGIELSGDVLTMRVEFSGCNPAHDFTLYMTGGFMESNPVQARLVLGHDSFGQTCHGWFERTLHFDLKPLREAFERAYGNEGPVLLRFTDLQGSHHEFRYQWGSPGAMNLLHNGSFERRGQPTLEGWEIVDREATSLVPEAAPEGGGWALRLEAASAPTTGFVRAAVPDVVDGEEVRLSAWVRAEEGEGGAMMYLQSGSWRSETIVSESPRWSPISLVSKVSITSGDRLWVVLSSLHTEIMPRVGLFDQVALERVSGLP